ncbi:hypothetical protein HDU81_008401 [Chytriomyces hyalinus]|nr:hypothetical protein HDU81_008401 [Chytriomyces hyalinus]
MQEFKFTAAAVDESKGRHLVSNTSIKAGQVLGVEPASFSVPSTETRCARCLSQSKASRCSRCKHVFYCSQTCQKNDWNAHKLECALIAGVMDSTPGLASSNLLIIRQVARVMPLLQRDSIQSLVSNREHFQDSVISAFGSSALLIASALARMPESSLWTHFKSLDPDTLVNVMCKLACNAVGIVDVKDQIDCGVGLYPNLIALVNHSCVPNCAVTFEPGSHAARLVALKDIEIGEDISVSYVDSAEPWMTRQEDLKKRYFFTCTCSLCKRQKMEETAVKSESQKSAIATIEKLEAALSGSQHDIESIAPKLLQLQLQQYPPLSPHILKTRQKVYNVALERQMWLLALSVSREMMPAMLDLYPQNSPNIGLQYLAMTRLSMLVIESGAVKPKELVEWVDKALGILNTTLGRQHPLTVEACEKRDEVHAMLRLS